MGKHNFNLAGDRYALSGAWSPPTSTANFCEEDYLVTRYLAEFINSLTNLTYVFFALRYMYDRGRRGLFNPRLDFMSVALLVLGFASFLFHATLRQNFQFGDELSMLGLVWAILEGILTVRRSSSYDTLVNVALAAFFVSFSGFYVWTGKLIYHYVAFGTIIGLIVVRGHYLFLWRKPGFPDDLRREWIRRGLTSLGVLIFAFVLWNIDLEFCAQLRQLREHVGLPWAWLFELHGWWHVLTAVSAEMWMTIVRELQVELKKEKSK